MARWLEYKTVGLIRHSPPMTKETGGEIRRNYFKHKISRQAKAATKSTKNSSRLFI